MVDHKFGQPWAQGKITSHTMAPSGVPSDSWVECLIADIVSCYTCLSQRPALAPSPEVNRLFTKLVRICSQTLDEAATAAVRSPPRDRLPLSPLTRGEALRYSKMLESSASPTHSGKYALKRNTNSRSTGWTMRCAKKRPVRVRHHFASVAKQTMRERC